MRDKLQGEVKKMLCMMRSLYSIGEKRFSLILQREEL
jgi:hypothetical protein